MTRESITVSFDSKLAGPSPFLQCGNRTLRLRTPKSLDFCAHLVPELYVASRNNCGAVRSDAWSIVMHLSYTSRRRMLICAGAPRVYSHLDLSYLYN